MNGDGPQASSKNPCSTPRSRRIPAAVPTRQKRFDYARRGTCAFRRGNPPLAERARGARRLPYLAPLRRSLSCAAISPPPLDLTRLHPLPKVSESSPSDACSDDGDAFTIMSVFAVPPILSDMSIVRWFR